jgi:hypothetical protein
MPIHARHSFREIRRAHTDRRVADLAPLIAELRATDVTSLLGAGVLDERSIPSDASGPAYPGDFSDSFYYRAIRTRIGQVLRSVPTSPYYPSDCARPWTRLILPRAAGRAMRQRMTRTPRLRGKLLLATLHVCGTGYRSDLLSLQ